MATQENTTTSARTIRSIDQDRYDAAMLRISCASNIMKALSIYGSEEPTEQPTVTVLSSALYGVSLMIDDAYNGIADSMSGGAV